MDDAHMAAALTSELRRRLEALTRSAPTRRLDVIVTLAPGTNAQTFSHAGLTIEQRIAEPPLVMGTATPAHTLALARTAGVALVEIDDGGVHALE